MVLSIPPNYYEMAFHHELGGSLHEAVCTMGFHYTGADVDGDLPKVQQGWEALMVEVQQSWSFTSWTARVQGGTYRDFILIPPKQGSGTDAACTSLTAFLLQKTTAVPGRRGRGRLFLPGVGENDVNAQGILTGTKLGKLQTALNSATADWAAGHWGLVLLHNIPKGGVPGDAFPTPLNGIYFSAQVGTQKNRMPRQ